MTDTRPPDGLVLAGGRGQRFGGRDKGLLTVNGQPLAKRAADQLRPHCDRVFICCNRNREHYATFGYPLCADLRDGFEGPLAGIEAGLAATEKPRLLVVPCDTGTLPPDMVDQLIATQHSGDYPVVYAKAAGQHHYLCALIARELRGSLSDYLARGERSVRGWYAKHRTGVVEFDEKIENLNDPASLGETAGD